MWQVEGGGCGYHALDLADHADLALLLLEALEVQILQLLLRLVGLVKESGSKNTSLSLHGYGPCLMACVLRPMTYNPFLLS